MEGFWVVIIFFRLLWSGLSDECFAFAIFAIIQSSYSDYWVNFIKKSLQVVLIIILGWTGGIGPSSRANFRLGDKLFLEFEELAIDSL